MLWENYQPLILKKIVAILRLCAFVHSLVTLHRRWVWSIIWPWCRLLLYDFQIGPQLNFALVLPLDRDQAVHVSWSRPRFLLGLHEDSGQRPNVFELHDHWHVYLGRLVRRPNHARKLEESCFCGMLLSSMDKSLLPDASILGHSSFHYSYISDYIRCQNLFDNVGHHLHGLR